MPERSTRERRKLTPVNCVYCGVEFTPELQRRPDVTVEFFNRVANLMDYMIKDGCPLECGKCREMPTFSKTSKDSF